jgi:hypothetical protein
MRTSPDALDHGSRFTRRHRERFRIRLATLEPLRWVVELSPFALRASRAIHREALSKGDGSGIEYRRGVKTIRDEPLSFVAVGRRGVIRGGPAVSPRAHCTGTPTADRRIV